MYTVGFRNFNLRIFNLRVSNPSKLIVDISFDAMSDFNVPGSRPKKARCNFGNRPYVCMCVYIYIYVYVHMYLERESYT